MNERQARMWLAAILNTPDPRFAQALAKIGPVELVAQVGAGKLGDVLRRRAAAIDPEQLIAKTEKLGLRFLIPGDDEWPSQLDALDYAEPVAGFQGRPIGLWVAGAGDLRKLDPSVAIVGSRAATNYGVACAEAIGHDLARAGQVVISGGAYGIDAAAHRGALAATGGATAAVMASGLDRLYPQGNHELLDRIRRDHLLISELPPGSPPARYRFLARNRIIAALSSATVIVEAALRSGARNTVSWACALGRPVLAVPGPINSVSSTTPHRLIRDHEATLVTGAADVLEAVGEIGQAEQPPLIDESRPLDQLNEIETQVYECLPARKSLTASEVCAETGLAVAAVLKALNSLAARGFVGQRESGWRISR